MDVGVVVAVGVGLTAGVGFGEAEATDDAAGMAFEALGTLDG